MLYGDGIHNDTEALQMMLDKCGEIRIERPGTYLIQKTLIIRSHTRLILSPGVRLLAAPLSRCALIENEHFANPEGRDESIEIIGGIFDGNCDAMEMDAVYEAKHRLDNPYSPHRFMGKLIRFAHVDRIVLEKLTVRNPVSYGIQIGDTYGFIVRDIFFDYNWHFGTTDGVHINGPAYGGVIENLCGTTNDDMVSLTCYDEPHAEITKGNIANVSIRNIVARNGYSGIRLLAGENYTMQGIHIDGIYGDYRHYGVIISDHCLRSGQAWFDGITIENVRIEKSPKPLCEDCFTYWEGNYRKHAVIQMEKRAQVGDLVLRNLSRHEAEHAENPMICITGDVTVHRLYAENIRQTVPDAKQAPIWHCEGRIHTRIEQAVEA